MSEYRIKWDVSNYETIRTTMTEPHIQCILCNEWVLSSTQETLIGHLMKHLDNKHDWQGLIALLYCSEVQKWTKKDGK